ncbi:hypothetical protein D3C79_888490 [compost metagenome]
MAQIVPWYRGQLQVVGTRRILGKVLTGEALLLVQQRGDGAILLSEKLFQRLDLNQRCFVQRRQILQCQVAANRMVGPAPCRRSDATEQHQQKFQLHCY